MVYRLVDLQKSRLSFQYNKWNVQWWYYARTIARARGCYKKSCGGIRGEMHSAGIWAAYGDTRQQSANHKKILQTSLNNFLMKNKIIPINQIGFQKEKAMQGAVEELQLKHSTRIRKLLKSALICQKLSIVLIMIYL